MFFKRKIRANIESLGEIIYEEKYNCWRSKNNVTIHNTDQVQLEEVNSKINHWYNLLQENIDSIVANVILKLKKDENMIVTNLEIVSISIYPSKAKIEAEISFKEKDSGALGSLWPLVAVDEELKIKGGIGLED